MNGLNNNQQNLEVHLLLQYLILNQISVLALQRINIAHYVDIQFQKKIYIKNLYFIYRMKI